MIARLFFLLWIFTLTVETISLQSRLAIFGGMGWLTNIKYTGFWERLGFITTLAVFSAAFCGLWVGMFRLFFRKRHQTTMLRWCATSWVILVAADLFFRHKVAEILGNAFNFFDFATGVGGVWRMIEQAFQWYGDVILLAVGGIAAISVASWFFFRWFLNPKRKMGWCEHIPHGILTGGVCLCTILGFLFMSILAPSFPGTRDLLASETLFGATIQFLIKKGSDVDGDGYGVFDLPPDDAPFDETIHPHAIDIPNDGIDQDQLLGDLTLDALPASTRQRIDTMGTGGSMSYLDRRHVIIVIMESVRYDMLDARIDGHPVMPELTRFIDELGAVRVDGAFATRGFTQNSVTQTFWGSYFDPGHTLVDDFKALGYHTASFSGEDLLDEGFDESLGWNRAGDTVVDPRSVSSGASRYGTVPAKHLMNDVEQFLAEYDTSTPLFMYVFYQDPHFPYQQDNDNILDDRPIHRSEITAETRPRLWHTYANQVHHLDMAAGRLLRALKDRDMLDNSLILFVSDHGESLFDDGYLLGHGIAISDIMTHCVMAVRGAHSPVPAHLSHVDIRRFIHEDFLAQDSRASWWPKPTPPVLQFIGASTVPTAISHRYDDGRRVTYEFATHSASRENPFASFDQETTALQMTDHGNTPIDARVNPNVDLKPGTRREAHIPNPMSDPDVQYLIRTWEYLQWQKRQ